MTKTKWSRITESDGRVFHTTKLYGGIYVVAKITGRSQYALRTPDGKVTICDSFAKAKQRADIDAAAGQLQRQLEGSLGKAIGELLDETVAVRDSFGEHDADGESRYDREVEACVEGPVV